MVVFPRVAAPSINEPVANVKAEIKAALAVNLEMIMAHFS
jgi:hypothetical protein